MASHSSAPNALLSSYINDALAMLKSKNILNYFQKKDLDQSLLEKLRSSLLSINLVMDDAENKHLSNKYDEVSSWLYEVRDAVHDVDDILDEIQTEASKSKLLPVAEFQTPTSSFSFDEEVQSRLKEVLANLESLASDKDPLGLENINSSGAAKPVSQRLKTTSLVDETTISGRDNDKKAISDLLLSNDICGREYDKNAIINLLKSDNDKGIGRNNLTVISIVGLGGMGKTTLAQLVFNDRSMDAEFQLKAWVCVSQDFDVIKVTRSILQALGSSPTSDRDDLNTLQRMLKEKLVGKKYLLALDDVWEEKNKKWEALQAPLLYGARGSKILVTTRSEKVASIMQCAHVYPLKHLSEEQSWSLFAKHALSPANSTSDFEEIGKKIINKCDGLPLALKAIGSLLYNYSYDKWNAILTSDMWERDMFDTRNDIMPALILSYQFLSSLLKRCFAYCSLIPKDYEFRRDWLIELWMAENFLQVHQLNKGMKELGDQFFNDLLSRSFFQRSISEEELFVMPNLVNDLAKYVSRKFCLRLEEEHANYISKMTRHISKLRKYKDFEKFEATCKANKLRTFLSSSSLVYMSSKQVDDFMCKWKCLYALSLQLKDDNLPDSIGNFKHLRYLDLSDCYHLKKLPDSTCLLYNLQTLKLTGCFCLEELPSDMHKLVNLIHLNFEETKVRKLPDGMGNLKKLEVLCSYYVGKCGEVNINQLGELPRLRGKLSIEDLQNVTDPNDAAEADLKNKIHLEELWLRWDNSNKEVRRDGYEIEEDVLEKLQPPAILKKLYIEYYDGTKFPEWLGDMCINNNNNNTIVSLELIGCKYCVSLPPLGMLPSLKELRIIGLQGIKSIGKEFYGSNSSSSIVDSPPPFISLQFLRFQNMKGWEEWDCENASSSSSSSSSPAFPCLEKLDLFNCPLLKTKLPQHLPSLLQLHVSLCPQLVGAYKTELPGSSYTRLQSLHIRGFEIQILLQGHPCLRHLVLKDIIHTIDTFPLYLFSMLKQLTLNDCRKLESLDAGSGGTATGGVTSHCYLTRLELRECPEFVSIPQTLFFPSLTELVLYECPKLASVPPFNLFPSLTALELLDCPEVKWPEPEEKEEEEDGGGFPSTLEKLEITNCPKLVASHNKWDLHTLTSLTLLTIQDEYYDYVDCNGWLSMPPNLKLLNWKHVGTSPI